MQQGQLVLLPRPAWRRLAVEAVLQDRLDRAVGPGADLDAAQVLVQNRVAIATPRLPQEVQRLGIVTKKTTPDFLMVVNLVSPDRSLDTAYLSNYALTQVKDRLARIEGVGDVQMFGARDFAMRVWIDPDRLAARGLSPGDVHAALQRNNYLAAVGQTKSNLVQVNLLANTDLRAVDDRGHADRRGAVVLGGLRNLQPALLGGSGNGLGQGVLAAGLCGSCQRDEAVHVEPVGVVAD